ncbi:MAG: hypothetical protein JWP63_3922 [Candidatus Solibacter sp.]|jgi:hypothetical protein|nr:hypothetical protein [Candidatus Solibacter sp.]
MMRRAALTLFAIALCCPAAGDSAIDPATEVLDLFTDIAASLSAGNVPRFLAAFDPAMPDYAALRDNVTALVAQGDIQSFIDPVENQGDASSRTVEWKWTLRLRRGEDATGTLVREQTVKATVTRRGAKWRVTQLDPVSFFAPATSK